VACLATVAAATAGATAAEAAAVRDAAPLHQAQGRPIAGQYIVVLKDGGDGAALARRHGVAPLRVYGSALHGFAARLSGSQLAQIRRDAQVAYVDQDGVATITGKPNPGSSQVAPRGGRATGPHGDSVNGQAVQPNAPWGLDRVDQRARPLNGTYRYASVGSGVTAYIIDTGIMTSHADFGGRAIGGFTAINDGRGATDCNGHGTHVAGTTGGATYGVAKNVRLVAVRVLDCTGSGAWSGVIAGVDWVTNNRTGASVANMSLAGGFTQAVNDAVTNSIAQGVTYALAAANSNDNACNYSPASTPAALTVAATDINDTRAGFSNWGACVDVHAPGVNITSAWITSNTSTAVLSGTSMASPHVAGLVALFLQVNPFATQATVNSVITGSAAVGLVTDPRGSPNLLARKWNGTIAGTGASSYEPDGTYWFQNNGGYIRAWMQGIGGTDPDLYLQRWNGSAWVTVAGSTSVTPVERIVYNSQPASYYRLQAYGYSGGGSYDVWTTRPS